MGLLEMFRITGRVAVEYSEAQRGIEAVSGSADNAAESVKGTTSKTSKFSKTLSALGTVAGKVGTVMSNVAKAVGLTMTAVGTGVIAAGKAATGVGKTFESSVSQIAATMGKSVKEIDDLKEKAKEMGAATQFSATEAADGLNILAMSGLDAKEQMVSIDKVLNLAAAGSLRACLKSEICGFLSIIFLITRKKDAGILSYVKFF